MEPRGKSVKEKGNIDGPRRAVVHPEVTVYIAPSTFPFVFATVRFVSTINALSGFWEIVAGLHRENCTASFGSFNGFGNTRSNWGVSLYSPMCVVFGNDSPYQKLDRAILSIIY
jgi:hypothetical protein